MSVFGQIASGGDITSEWGQAVEDALGGVGTSVFPLSSADYTIYKSGSTYYARNGNTGAVTSNATFHTLIQECMDALTGGGLIFFKPGTYSWTGKITNSYDGCAWVGANHQSTVLALDSTSAEYSIERAADNALGVWFVNLQFDCGTTNLPKALIHNKTTFPAAKALSWFHMINCKTETFQGDHLIDFQNYDYIWFVMNRFAGNPLFRFSTDNHSSGNLNIWRNIFALTSFNVNIVEVNTTGSSSACGTVRSGHNQFYADTSTTACAYYLNADAQDISKFSSVEDRAEGLAFLNTATAGGNTINWGTIAEGRFWNDQNQTFISIADGCEGFTIHDCSLSGPAGATGIADANSSTTRPTNIRKNSYYTNLGTWVSTTVGATIASVMPMSTTSLDLCGGASDIVIWQAPSDCWLVGYDVIYTEASSADAGVNIRVGRYEAGALDDDHFDLVTSEISKSIGYVKHYVTADLTAKSISADDLMTVGTAGGKAGTGQVRLKLKVAGV